MDQIKLAQKVAVITGANGGMGQAITRAMLAEGYQVVMACRNIDKASVICENLKAKCGNSVSLIRVDLSSFASIHNFVEEFKQNYSRVDLLLNNAGVIYPFAAKTEDGFEMNAGVNYLGPSLLSHLLFPFMKHGTRVVNMISLTHKYGKISESFFNPVMKNYNRFKSYANSKLALLYFTLDVAEKWKEYGISVNCVDPGIVDTGMLKMGNPVVDGLCNMFFRPLAKSAEKGAKTYIFAALSDKVKDITGHCFANEKPVKIPSKILQNPQRIWLRQKTEEILETEKRHRENITQASL